MQRQNTSKLAMPTCLAAPSQANRADLLAYRCPFLSIVLTLVDVLSRARRMNRNVMKNKMPHSVPLFKYLSHPFFIGLNCVSVATYLWILRVTVLCDALHMLSHSIKHEELHHPSSKIDPHIQDRESALPSNRNSKTE